VNFAHIGSRTHKARTRNDDSRGVRISRPSGNRIEGKDSIIQPPASETAQWKHSERVFVISKFSSGCLNRARCQQTITWTIDRAQAESERTPSGSSRGSFAARLGAACLWLSGTPYDIRRFGSFFEAVWYCICFSLLSLYLKQHWKKAKMRNTKRSNEWSSPSECHVYPDNQEGQRGAVFLPS